MREILLDLLLLAGPAKQVSIKEMTEVQSMQLKHFDLAYEHGDRCSTRRYRWRDASKLFHLQDSSKFPNVWSFQVYSGSQVPTDH